MVFVSYGFVLVQVRVKDTTANIGAPAAGDVTMHAAFVASVFVGALNHKSKQEFLGQGILGE
jgi:hypothetical protein